jgi:GPH family glycoside/pentoside/hexuronide:cation symporter
LEQQELEPRHSKLNMASYGSGSLAREFINMAFATTVFFYYEVALGVDVWIITIAMFIFAFYNMINDPMLGYLINRPFKFTQRLGRRFPWLLIGGIPLCFSYLIIFTPPVTDPLMVYGNISGEWILFLWLLLTICVFDTFHSLYFVNFMSLFPEKYRSDRERRTASGIYIPIGVIGVALGAMIPPLVFIYPEELIPKSTILPSFIVQGIVVALICLLGMLLAIPGFREDKDLVQTYLNTYEQNPERESFFRSLWTALKQKSFVVYMVIYTMYQSQVTTMQNSVNYAVSYVVDKPGGLTTNTMATLIFAAFLVGVVIATPFWVRYSHRANNNKKVMLISSIGLGITTLPLLFITNYWGVVITMLIWGLFLGGFWFMIFPVMSDVIDESVAITGRREEAVYAGFSQFFARIGIIAQTLTFAIVHTLTGFKEGVDPILQPPSAAVGIQIHLGLIPAIFIFIGAFVFWRWYKLTPDKIAENRLKIGEFSIK